MTCSGVEEYTCIFLHKLEIAVEDVNSVGVMNLKA